MLNSFEKFCDQIASFFGEDKEGSLNKISNAKSFSYPDMLAKELPYESYDPAKQIFYNRASLGFVLEASPLIGASDETVKLLQSLMIDNLPKDAYVQFMMLGSPKIGGYLDYVKSTRSAGEEIFRWLAEKRNDYLQKAAYQSLSKTKDYLIRDLRLFISVSVPESSKVSADKLVVTRNNFITSLKSIHMHAVPVHVNNFIGLIYDILHPSSDLYPTKKTWNRHENLSSQVTRLDTKIIDADTHLKICTEDESWEVRSLAVEDTPLRMTQWQMMDSIGQLFNATLQIPCPFLIQMTMRVLDREKEGLKAQLKYINTGKKANSKLSQWLSKLSAEYTDWRFVREQLNLGDELADVCFSVTLFSQQDKGAEHEAKVKDLYRSNGWALNNALGMQIPHLLLALPLTMGDGLADDLMRLGGYFRRMLVSNAISIAPLQGEWKGTETPTLILPGRRGQIATWGAFDNEEGNYNVALAAASGKGKSALIQDYVVGLLGGGGRCWVIDVGRSYEKTCNLVGGQFIEFSKDSDICLNPFTYIRNFDDSLALLKPLLAAMARPTTKTSDEENAYIEKALKAAWNKKKNRSSITTVSEWLEAQKNATCQNLAHLLYPFTKEGMYGHYFEEESDISTDSNFLVLELGELKSKPDLQRIVLLTLMYKISEAFYWGERSQHKSCIIDEAWDLLSGEQAGAAKFIEVGYRTARKYNGNFITIVQSINDYFKNEASISAFENSDTNIILGQTEEAIEQLKKSGRLSIDPYVEHLLKSLRKTDEYSECVIKRGSRVTLHRIIFDPYSLILYSSKGDECDEVQALVSKNMPLQDAIGKVAEKFHNV